MISHAWTVICEKTIIDRDTNNLSLDVLEQISFVGVPRETGTALQLPLQVSIVSLWYRTIPEQEAQSQARIAYIAPDETVLGYINQALDFSQYRRLRSIATMPILATIQGRYFFRVELLENDEWHEVARVPFEIHIQSEEPRAST